MKQIDFWIVALAMLGVWFVGGLVLAGAMVNSGSNDRALVVLLSDLIGTMAAAKLFGGSI